MPEKAQALRRARQASAQAVEDCGQEEAEDPQEPSTEGGGEGAPDGGEEAPLLRRGATTTQPHMGQEALNLGSGGVRRRLSGKTISVEGRFAVSKSPNLKQLRAFASFPEPSAFDISLVASIRDTIHQFLEFDMSRGGSASADWATLLALAYPVLAEKPLEDTLLAFVLRCLRNRGLPSAAPRGQVIEYYAGAGGLTLEHIKLGFHCVRLDRAYDASHDCSTTEGLRLWLDLLCMTEARSLQWFGTQCSSFVALCRHQSQRKSENSFLGDRTRAFVREGNMHMLVTSVFFLVVDDGEPPSTGATIEFGFAPHETSVHSVPFYESVAHNDMVGSIWRFIPKASAVVSLLPCPRAAEAEEASLPNCGGKSSCTQTGPQIRWQEFGIEGLAGIPSRV